MSECLGKIHLGGWGGGGGGGVLDKFYTLLHYETQINEQLMFLHFIPDQKQ